MTKITLPPKKYYRLPDIAKIWGCSVDDLLDYAEQGRLTIVAEPCDDKLKYLNPAFDGQYAERWMLDTYMFPINQLSIREFRNGTSQRQDGSFPFICYFHPGGEGEGLDGLVLLKGHFMEEQLVITHEEKEHFERGSISIQQIPKEKQPEIIERGDHFRRFLMEFMHAIPPEKKKSASDVYQELLSNQSLRMATDTENYIKLINPIHVLTTDDKPSKQMFSKKTVIKRIERLIQKLS